MKKLFILFAGIILAISLAGCGGKEATTTNAQTVVTCQEGYTLVGDTCVLNGTQDSYPVIAGVSDVEITVGDSFDPLAGVSASDTEDGDLTSSIRVTSTVDFTQAGRYKITYEVSDKDGHITTVDRKVYIQDFVYIPPFDGRKKFLPVGSTKFSCGEWISFF